MDHTLHTNPHGARRTALVLGGGGSTGNAWLIGVVAGLSSAGLDVADADLTVGTSAGSTAAAQLAGATPAELFADILRGTPARPGAPAGATTGRPSNRPVVDHLARTRQIIDSSDGPANLRRNLGAAALERAAGSDGSWQTQWRATVASRFAGHTWPQRTVLITAVEAETGEPVVFDRSSGVDLVDAVAASCSSGLPYAIGERHYIDGGYRTNAENADLATGFDRVLVLSPFGGRSLAPARWGTHLAAQVEALRDTGSTVTTISPRSDDEQLFGVNAMDGSLRPAAARAGYDQGAEIAPRLADGWRPAAG